MSAGRAYHHPSPTASVTNRCWPPAAFRFAWLDLDGPRAAHWDTQKTPGRTTPGGSLSAIPRRVYDGGLTSTSKLCSTHCPKPSTAVTSVIVAGESGSVSRTVMVAVPKVYRREGRQPKTTGRYLYGGNSSPCVSV